MYTNETNTHRLIIITSEVSVYRHLYIDVYDLQITMDTANPK